MPNSPSSVDSSDSLLSSPPAPQPLASQPAQDQIQPPIEKKAINWQLTLAQAFVGLVLLGLGLAGGYWHSISATPTTTQAPANQDPGLALAEHFKSEIVGREPIIISLCYDHNSSGTCDGNEGATPLNLYAQLFPKDTNSESAYNLTATGTSSRTDNLTFRGIEADDYQLSMHVNSDNYYQPSQNAGSYPMYKILGDDLPPDGALLPLEKIPLTLSPTIQKKWLIQPYKPSELYVFHSGSMTQFFEPKTLRQYAWVSSQEMNNAASARWWLKSGILHYFDKAGAWQAFNPKEVNIELKHDPLGLAEPGGYEMAKITADGTAAIVGGGNSFGREIRFFSTAQGCPSYLADVKYQGKSINVETSSDPNHPFNAEGLRPGIFLFAGRLADNPEPDVFERLFLARCQNGQIEVTATDISSRNGVGIGLRVLNRSTAVVSSQLAYKAVGSSDIKFFSGAIELKFDDSGAIQDIAELPQFSIGYTTNYEGNELAFTNFETIILTSLTKLAEGVPAGPKHSVPSGYTFQNPVWDSDKLYVWQRKIDRTKQQEDKLLKLWLENGALQKEEIELKDMYQATGSVWEFLGVVRL